MNYRIKENYEILRKQMRFLNFIIFYKFLFIKYGDIINNIRFYGIAIKENAADFSYVISAILWAVLFYSFFKYIYYMEVVYRISYSVRFGIIVFLRNINENLFSEMQKKLSQLTGNILTEIKEENRNVLDRVLEECKVNLMNMEKIIYYYDVLEKFKIGQDRQISEYLTERNSIVFNVIHLKKFYLISLLLDGIPFFLMILLLLYRTYNAYIL